MARDFGSEDGKKETLINSKTKKSKTFEEGNELKITVLISFTFFLCFTSYTSVENLQTSLNRKDDLGLWSLFGIYGSYMLIGILAPAVIRLLGIKTILVVGWICHLLYMASNFYPTFYTLIPASVIMGLASPLLWVSENVYLSTLAISYATRTDQPIHAVLSRFNGIFYIFFGSNIIPGNLISSLVFETSMPVMEHHNQSYYNICGSASCPSESTDETIFSEPDQLTVYIFLSILLACQLAALFLTLVCVPKLKRSEWSLKVTLLKSFVGCCSTFGDYRMVLLVPLIMSTTFEKAARFTDFTKEFVSCPYGIQMVGFAMASFGAATALCAFIFGRLAQHTGRYALFALAIVINMGIYIAMYHWQPKEDQLYLIFVMSITWGVAEGIWQTQMTALIALLFSDKKEPAFANYHTFKAAGYTTYFIMSYFLCVRTKLLVAMVFLAFGGILYALVEIIVKCRTNAEQNDHDIDIDLE